MPTAKGDPQAWAALARAKGLAPAGAGEAAAVVSVPPSANNLFFTTRRGGRAKSAGYKAWLAANAGACGRLARPAALPCRVRLTVEGPVPFSRDLDNMVKPVLDCVVLSGSLPDDNRACVSAVEVRYRPRPGGAGVRVELLPDDGEVGT